MFCTNCGSRIPDGERACSACGQLVPESLVKEVVTPVVEVTEPEVTETVVEEQPEVSTSSYQEMGYQETSYQETGYQQTTGSATPNQEREQDKILWGMLGCCVPLVGLILFILWKDNKPMTSKALAIGAIVGTVLGGGLYILFSILSGVLNALVMM